MRSPLGTPAHLVYPQLAHNNVVHGCGDFLPSVVVPGRVENTVDATWKQREAHTFSQILKKNRTMLAGNRGLIFFFRYFLLLKGKQ